MNSQHETIRAYALYSASIRVKLRGPDSLEKQSHVGLRGLCIRNSVFALSREDTSDSIAKDVSTRNVKGDLKTHSRLP